MTIEQMQAIAKSRGGKCLSKKYVGVKKKLKWECEKGHRWEAHPNTVKNGRWCHDCAGNKKLTIEEMQAIAKSRGGKCLSKKYVGGKKKLKWECEKGHRWEATAEGVKSGTWCPDCSGNKKLTIEEMQAIAKKRGGKCLSKKYLNRRTKLQWECEQGHRWETAPGNIKSGSWCPECVGRKKLTIEEMQAIAKSRGGKCLSKKYVGGKKKLKWECEKGHRWEATSTSVKMGTWCIKCYHISVGVNRMLTIEEMHKIAKSRGGKCLSKKYLSAIRNLKWECSEGHQWSASPNTIKNKPSWCPICSTGISERICREYFRQLFGKPFPKSRPSWLNNSAGNQMELDGFCKSLRIAFEHQGEQHYTKNTQFISSDKELNKRLKYDIEKKLLCSQNGIRLFLIPALFGRTELEDLQRFIYDECKRLKVRRPAGMIDKKINLKNAWSNNLTRKKYKEICLIAKNKGGKCISDYYISARTKLQFECENGHQWMVAPTHVINSGSWCPECAGLKKLTIEEMQAIAKSRGGKCLSKKYVGGKKKLKWECFEGHQWLATPNEIKNKPSWCPDCSGKKKLTIEEMHKIAKSRGGKCHSKKYVNNKTKLQWECEEGHRWQSNPEKIKLGQWCPDCAGVKKLTIEEMHKIAKSRGGKCLSKKYVNGSTKLKWECEKGHRWKAIPYSVKGGIRKGTWCPECRGK